MQVVGTDAAAIEAGPAGHGIEPSLDRVAHPAAFQPDQPRHFAQRRIAAPETRVGRGLGQALGIDQQHVDAGPFQNSLAAPEVGEDVVHRPVAQDVVGAELPDHQIGPSGGDLTLQPAGGVTRGLAADPPVDDRDLDAREAALQSRLQQGDEAELGSGGAHALD